MITVNITGIKLQRVNYFTLYFVKCVVYEENVKCKLNILTTFLFYMIVVYFTTCYFLRLYSVER
jgi:hypothetical protein